MCVECLWMIKPEWLYKTLRFSPLAVERSVVVMTASSQSRQSHIEYYVLPIFYSHFMNFVFRISKVLRSYLRTPALRVQLQLGWNIYLLFNSDSELYVENRSGGARKHCFVNIFPLGWDGAESRIQGQLISHPFPGGISAKAISITHSDMLHRPDISTF